MVLNLVVSWIPLKRRFTVLLAIVRHDCTFDKTVTVVGKLTFGESDKKLPQKLHKVIMGLAKHIIIKPFNPSDSQETEWFVSRLSNSKTKWFRNMLALLVFRSGVGEIQRIERLTNCLNYPTQFTVYCCIYGRIWTVMGTSATTSTPKSSSR